MKLRNMVAPVVFGALTIAGTQVHATGTIAGTSIDNTATLSYEVNTVPQANVTDTANFVVDIKVDFAVARLAGNIFKTSLDTDNIVVGAFSVTNQGNTPATFALSAADTTGDVAATDGTFTDNHSFTSPTFTIYEDIGADRVLTTENTPVTNISLTKDGVGVTKNYIVTVPKEDIVGVNEQVIATALTVVGKTATPSGLAPVVLDGTAAAPGQDGYVDDRGTAHDAASVQVVFADGVDGSVALGNNFEKASDAIQLTFPDFTPKDPLDPNNPANEKNAFVKVAEVVWDPLNGSLNTTPGSEVYPKAIPGAVVKYTIVMRNLGDVAASDLSISDPIPGSSVLCSADESNKPALAPASVCTNPTSTEGWISTFTPTTEVVTDGVIDNAKLPGEVQFDFATYPANQATTVTFYTLIQ